MRLFWAIPPIDGGTKRERLHQIVKNPNKGEMMKKLLLLPMLALFLAGCRSNDYGTADEGMADPDVGVTSPADPPRPVFDDDVNSPASPGSIDDNRLDDDSLDDDDTNRIDNTPPSPGDSGTEPLP